MGAFIGMGDIAVDLARMHGHITQIRHDWQWCIPWLHGHDTKIYRARINTWGRASF